MDKNIEKKVKVAILGGLAGCYATQDAQIFKRDHSGLTFATGHNPAGICEFNAEAKLVSDDVIRDRTEAVGHIDKRPDILAEHKPYEIVQMNLEELRALLAEDAPEEGGDVIDLDAMNKKQLRALLADLNPTIGSSKMNNEEIKDAIEAASTLEEYDAKQLLALIKATDKTDDEAVLAGVDDEKALTLSTDDLRALALLIRDEVHTNETQEALDRLAMIADDEDA